MLSLSKKIWLSLSGVLMALIIVESSLQLAGWLYLMHDNLRNKTEIENTFGKDVIRILCLGQCYTVGVGILPEQTYPRQLERILRQKYPDKQIVVINKGTRGKNLSFFINNLEKFIIKFQPQIIILNINYRIDYYDENILLANSDLLPFQERVKIAAGMFLNKIKTFKILSLMLHSKMNTTAKPFDNYGVPLEESLKVEENSAYASRIALFKAQLEIDPKDYRKWTRLAIAYSGLGLFDLAIESAEKSIELNPNDGRNYFYLFWFHCGLRQFESAMEMRKKAFEVEPNLARDLRYIIHKYERDLEMNPRDMPACRYLFRAYAYMGEYKKAVEIVKKFSKNSKLPVDVDGLPRADYIRGRYAKTIKRLVDYLEGNEASDDRTYMEGKNKLREFKKSMKRLLKEKGVKRYPKEFDGRKLFSRLLRYDLTKCIKITKSRNIGFILENMGSSSEQQELIKKICKELNINLVDLFALFKDLPERDTYFLPPPNTVRANSAGNKLIAEQINKTLLSSGILEAVIKKAN